MDWPRDDELLGELTAHAAGGETLSLEACEATRLAGGYAGAALWRIDLRLHDGKGDERTAAYVVKVCLAREVAVMRTIGPIGAATFPTLAASRLDEAKPEDPEASLFASPFYPGRDLTFGDPAPRPIVEDLARLHARFEPAAKPGWAWRIDKDQVVSFHAGACAALKRSERFRATTPDHADWLDRLTAMASSSPLVVEAEDYAPTLVHGDVHPGNVIASPDGYYTLIDWGNASWAPPMIDLANMVPLGSPAWDAYLIAYRAAGGATTECALRRSWRWAQGVTALMYLPWIAEHRDDAGRMIARALAADSALAAAGAGRLR